MDKFLTYKVRELVDKATNVVMNYTEIEGKVREATNDDPWGPTGPLMQELAHATFTYEHFPEVMSMLWKRMLQDNKTNWRRTYKSLLLLNYLVRNGSERVVTSSREHIYDLRSLENYTFVDENGKDQGINVRHKVRDLIDFINDDDKLRDERKKAKKNKDKYVGLSAEAASRFGGSSVTSRSSNDYGGYRDDFDRHEKSRDDDDYDGEKEDSDNDTYGSSRRYKDRPKSPITSPPSASTVPTTIDKKAINLNLKTNPKVIANRSTTAASKKIDLGAASQYGKGTDFGINSPTHRNTHSEDLFGVNNNDDVVPATPVDDFFKTDDVKAPAPPSDDDDFNPRAEEFGDFETAFGGAKTQPVTKTNGKSDEFTDFTAFTSASTADPVLPPAAAPSSDLLGGLGGDLFGGLGAVPPASKPSSITADLLSDFGGLSMGTTTAGNVLQPSNTIPDLLQPSVAGRENNAKQQPMAPVGSTWAGSLNIDLDDLMGSKKKGGPAPTMNQLKSTSNNTSPVHQVKPISMSPLTPSYNIPGGISGNTPAAFANFSPNQSNQFNAFQ